MIEIGVNFWHKNLTKNRKKIEEFAAEVSIEPTRTWVYDVQHHYDGMVFVRKFQDDENGDAHLALMLQEVAKPISKELEVNFYISIYMYSTERRVELSQGTIRLLSEIDATFRFTHCEQL